MFLSAKMSISTATINPKKLADIKNFCVLCIKIEPTDNPYNLFIFITNTETNNTHNFFNQQTNSPNYENFENTEVRLIPSAVLFICIDCFVLLHSATMETDAARGSWG